MKQFKASTLNIGAGVAGSPAAIFRGGAANQMREAWAPEVGNTTIILPICCDSVLTCGRIFPHSSNIAFRGFPLTLARGQVRVVLILLTRSLIAPDAITSRKAEDRHPRPERFLWETQLL
jgi:hypothetical protein